MNDTLDQRYIIGIDLGTTNSAVAYVDLADVDSSDDISARAGSACPDGRARRRIRHFGIPQLVALGELAPRSVLPSFLYLPGEHDLPAGGAALPWDDNVGYIVGELAREQGARRAGAPGHFGKILAQPCRS